MENANIPIHRDIMIPKRILPRLPPEFEMTTLGYLKEGALAQYRGPDAIHVHEYPDHWLFHRDYGDPRTFEGLLAHLVFDASEIPLSIMAGGVSGVAVGSSLRVKEERIQKCGNRSDNCRWHCFHNWRCNNILSS